MAGVRSEERLDAVPTQREQTVDTRPAAAPSPVHAPATLPSQRTAPSVETLAPLVAPASSLRKAPATRPTTIRSARVQLVLVAVAIVAVLAVLVAAIVIKTQRDGRAAELARAQGRVALEVRAQAADTEFFAARSAAVTAAAQADRLAGAVATQSATVTAAQSVLAGSPQAGDAPRATLQAAIDAAAAVTASLGAGTNRMAVDTAVAAVAAAQQAVTDAQAAWQAAETARVAAEQAAAQAAAEQAAAQQAAQAAAHRTAARTATPRAAKAPASAAAAAPAPEAPAAATAGDEFSAGSIGAALNDYRASQGLGPLSIVRSQARVDHAGQMAASGGIWHSTSRSMAEIVGRVMPVSASSMINAYANSPSHQAIMVGGYSTAYVGAVTSGGYLYTSIQFG